MNSYTLTMAFVVINALLALVWFGWRLARTVPGLWMTSEQFNATADWTRAGPHDQPPMSHAATTIDSSLRIINVHLERGETLEGFARGFFSPPRPVDWNPTLSTLKCPLLIAVTPHRMMLFEVAMLDGAAAWTHPNALKVLRLCSIGYDAIEYLRPPKRGVLGTSGALRFGLRSGREYQMGFLGPLFSDEGMREEQRLAAHLRRIAPRFASSRAPRTTTQRAA